MSYKLKGRESMVAGNLHVPREVIEEADKIAHVRRVSRAQVMREWIEIGRKWQPVIYDRAQ